MASPPTHEVRYKASPAPVIVGLEAIGAQFGRTRRTIRRWIAPEGFPASRLPDGAGTTTLASGSDIGGSIRIPAAHLAHDRHEDRHGQ